MMNNNGNIGGSGGGGGGQAAAWARKEMQGQRIKATGREECLFSRKAFVNRWAMSPR